MDRVKQNDTVKGKMRIKWTKSTSSPFIPDSTKHPLLGDIISV